MTDQQLKNLTFERLNTNTTLQVLATVLYEIQPSENESIRKLLTDELQSLQARVDRLHNLTRPKTR